MFRIVIAVICALLPLIGAADEPKPAAFAMEHVAVLPMTIGGSPLNDVTVVIRGGRIASIGPSGQKVAMPGVKRIDATGKWLIPGLTDMHAHIENDRMLALFLHDPSVPDGTVRTEDILTPYVVNGVVQVVSLQAMSESIGQRVDVNSGRVLGPRLVLAAMIDGAPPIWPVGMTRVAATPEDGRQVVRDAAAEGYDLIKVYSRLDLDTFTAIVAEARRLKLRVVGHIPGRGKGITDKFFQPGFDMVAHAEEFAQQTDPPSLDAIPRYVDMAKRNGTWLTATLTLDDRLLEETRHPETLKSRPELRFLTPRFREVVVNHNPYVAQASPERIQSLQQIVDFNRELVRAFVAAGIPVVAGTDAPVPGVVPGFALHDELQALAKAGLSNRQALESATRLPCEWLGLSAECGTVEVGKRADLLLLDADPLTEVGNTRRIAAVILGGRYLSRAMLDRRLADLEAHYSVH
jgi:imidazolonepropionase-like amidohydrolase